MSVASVLEFLTLLVLAATLPISVVAVREFEGAPFGRVLRPIPVVVLAFIVYNSPTYVDYDVPLTFYAVVSTVAVLGCLVAALEAALLLTERRRI